MRVFYTAMGRLRLFLVLLSVSSSVGGIGLRAIS